MEAVNPDQITSGLNVGRGCNQNEGSSPLSFWLVPTVSLSSLRRGQKGGRSRWTITLAVARNLTHSVAVAVRAQTQSGKHLQEQGSTSASLLRHLALWPAVPAARLLQPHPIFNRQSEPGSSCVIACADLVGCLRCECVCACIHQLVMYEIQILTSLMNHSSKLQEIFSRFFFLRFFHVLG